MRFRAEVLRDEFKELGIEVVSHPTNFFDTLTIDCAKSFKTTSDYVLSEFHKRDINLRKVDDKIVGISINETTTIDDLADLIEIFAFLKGRSEDVGSYL